MISVKLDNIHFDPLQEEFQDRFQQLFDPIISSTPFPTARDIVWKFLYDDLTNNCRRKIYFFFVLFL